MSTYDSAVYRDNTFQRIARHIGFKDTEKQLLSVFLDFNVEENGVHALPKGIVPGNLRAQVLAGTVDMKDVYDGPPIKRDMSVVRTFRAGEKVYYGIVAVYRMFSLLYRRRKEYEQFPDRSKVIELFQMGMILGQHTPKDAMLKGSVYAETWSKCGFGLKQMATDLVKVANTYTNKRYRSTMKDAKIGEQALPYVETPEARRLFRGQVACIRGCMFVRTPAALYVLVREDIDRLEKMLKGAANAAFYFKHPGQVTQVAGAKLDYAVSQYMDSITERMKVLDLDGCNKLGRALDVAYYIALARYSSDIDVVSLKFQIAKGLKDGLPDVLSCVHQANIVSELPIREGLDVMLIYKLLPNGDYDYFGATHRQQVLYSEKNVIEDLDLFGLIGAYHKKLMIKAYHSRHGVCPGQLMNPNTDVRWEALYPDVHPDSIDVSRVHDIKLTGQFVYCDHTLDVFDMVKDKAICPVDVHLIKKESELRRLERHQKNQLLDVLHRDRPVSMLHLRDDPDSLLWDIKTEDKAEAKKPGGRWFMECHTDLRLVMSEYEMSIANYAKYLEGYVLGKGIREKIQTMNHVTEAYGDESEHTQTFWSLDVDKWSPHMPIAVQRMCNEMWSDAFMQPHILRLDQLFIRGDLHYIKRNVHHVLKKSGEDYEGLSGKKLTFYHLAVMNAAAHILKEKKLVTGQARYAVLVDDGVLRFNVPRDNIETHVAKIRAELSRIWAAAGIKISWDKTFVSTEFAIFLNEIRYANRAICCGIRAILKMTNYVETVAPNITADLQKCESTARGALVAGALLTPVYFLYSLLVLDTVRKWAGRDVEFGQLTVLWLFAPVSLGGCGVVNALTMMGSLDFDGLQSGMANLFLAAHRWPNLVPAVNKILNQEIAVMSDPVRGTNPTAFRREAPIFRADRLRRSLEHAMTYYIQAPTISAYSIQEGREISKLLTTYVSREDKLPIELKDLAYSTTLENMVEQLTNKVLKSGTALAMLPKRTLFRVSCANVSEARRIIIAWH
jgi:hypothetical protein